MIAGNTPAPCLICKNPNVCAREHNIGSETVYTELQCLMCGAGSNIHLPLTPAVMVWNDQPRKSDTEVLREEMRAVRNASATRLERMVNALLSSGRVPFSHDEHGNPLEIPHTLPDMAERQVGYAKLLCAALERAESDEAGR